MAGTTVSLRYWPVAPVPPPCTSILVALEPTTSTVFFDINPPTLLYPTITIAPRLRPAARWAGRRTIQYSRRLVGAVGLKDQPKATKRERVSRGFIPSRSPSSHERQPCCSTTTERLVHLTSIASVDERDRIGVAVERRPGHVQLRCPLSNWRVLEPLLPNHASARSDENERPAGRMCSMEELGVDPMGNVLKALDHRLGAVPRGARLRLEGSAVSSVSSGNREVQEPEQRSKSATAALEISKSCQ